MKKNLEAESLISPMDLSLIRHCQEADVAVNEVTGFYSN